jgi:hypothetical protein
MSTESFNFCRESSEKNRGGDPLERDGGFSEEATATAFGMSLVDTPCVGGGSESESAESSDRRGDRT